MKPKLTTLLASLVLGCAPVSLQADEFRVFTSSDGSKTLEAKMTNYDATKGIVSLTLKNGAKMNTAIKNFSEADKEFAQAAQERFVAARRIDVRFTELDKETGETKNKSIGGNVTSRESGYSVDLRNNGQVALSGVTVKYKMFATKAGQKSKELVSMAGDLEYAAIQPRTESKVATKSFALQSVRPLPKAECVGGT